MNRYLLSTRGDRTKKPARHPYRTMTLDEVKVLRPGETVSYRYSTDTACSVKINGAIKRWKREPDKVEVPIKYGFYNSGCFRLTTREALVDLLVQLYCIDCGVIDTTVDWHEKEGNTDPLCATCAQKRVDRQIDNLVDLLDGKKDGDTGFLPPPDPPFVPTPESKANAAKERAQFRRDDIEAAIRHGEYGLAFMLKEMQTDEGCGIEKAEAWKNTIEEMMESANEVERKLLWPLFHLLRETLVDLLAMDKTNRRAIDAEDAHDAAKEETDLDAIDGGSRGNHFEDDGQ